jgi:Protein of unknown function (DUF3108)
MSHGILKGTAVLVLFGCAAAGYLWVRSQHEGRTVFPAEAAGPVVTRPPVAPGPTTNPSATARPGDAAAGAGVRESSPPSGEAAKKTVVDAGLPVRAGEVLEYSASMATVNNIATVRLQVGERKNFLGKNAWHLQAFAHTENPLRLVFVLDDQFDSYSDAGSMASLQYEMHLNEKGQKVDSVQRMTATGREGAPANVTEARVLAGTRDPLGMMQYLRTVDWTKTPEVRSPVYDGHKLYELRARRVSASEAVSVAAGKYNASKIAIHVFDNGVESKDAQFSLYLANNAPHTPVLIEAVIPVATARVELVRASGE